MKISNNNPITCKINKFVRQSAKDIQEDKAVQTALAKTSWPLDTLERQAELLSPQEYLTARKYVSSLEMSRLFYESFI